MGKLTISRAEANKILAMRKARSTLPPTLFNPLFPQQRAFCDDPAKLKVLWCTRRAAKSFTAGLYMVKEAIENPGCNVLFVGLTRASAKGIVWKDILKVVNKRYALRCKFNLAELTMTFSNGSVICITGIDQDEDEMNKLLGRKYRLVCIDEASLYTVNLRHFVYDILKPAMADLEGSICLFGTSSNFTRGLFYDITTNKEAGWSMHTWSAHQNPYVASQWQKQLDEIEASRPLYKQTPQYRQWFLNEWVVDTNKLVYKFNETKNMFVDLPRHAQTGWTYTLGIDLGYEDDTAFVLTGYHENDPTLYVIDTYNKKHMSLDIVAKKILEYMAVTDRAPSKIIIDGAAKQSVETMRVRYSIPFEYADKQGKSEFVEVLNADLIQGKIKIDKACRTLIDEMMSLVWVTDGEKIRLPRREHPSLSNHLCDALLYNWRMSFNYHFSPLVQTEVKGSREWYDQQSDKIWERERERLEQISNNSNSWGGSSNGMFDPSE